MGVSPDSSDPRFLQLLHIFVKRRDPYRDELSHLLKTIAERYAPGNPFSTSPYTQSDETEACTMGTGSHQIQLHLRHRVGRPCTRPRPKILGKRPPTPRR